eukprot:m.260901 g.260901  ORF g.260901 m.260901 type:complete len:451 (-) comp40858_c0_seq1:180-1532(-)
MSTMADFDQLDEDAQTRIREKQKAKKEAKKTHKFKKSKTSTVVGAGCKPDIAIGNKSNIITSSSNSNPTSTNHTIASTDADGKPVTVRTVISKDEYFSAASGGLFRDPHITATPESIELLFQILESGSEFGNQLCTCNYFQFAGSTKQIWDPIFNARLAWEGFFTITTKHRGNVEPLPELQPFYGVLFWQHFETSKPTKRVLNRLRKPNEAEKYELAHMVDPDRTWELLDTYHRRRNGSNWLTKQYFETMKAASNNPNINFQLNIVELYASNSNSNGNNSVPDSASSSDSDGTSKLELAFKSRSPLAGEIGFTIGGVYTSLSGWTSQRTTDGDGITQLVLLGRWLQAKGYSFWSLGHCYSPELDYKRTLGQHIYERNDFLALLHRNRGPFNVETTHPRSPTQTTDVTTGTNTVNPSLSSTSSPTAAPLFHQISHLKIRETANVRTLVEYC